MLSVWGSTASLAADGRWKVTRGLDRAHRRADDPPCRPIYHNAQAASEQSSPSVGRPLRPQAVIPNRATCEPRVASVCGLWWVILAYEFMAITPAPHVTNTMPARRLV